MVIAHKSNYAIQIFVDLSEVNKAIIPDRNLLSTIEELSQWVAEKTVFLEINL